MSIIIFIIILGILIFVHELGHFLIAKKSGIRVDEFAVGFPPRLWSKIKDGTRYSLNLIPFGGYVKIFGETIDDESADPNRADSFVNKSRMTQASVLVGGVVFNVIFAWILLSISFMSGFPTVVSEGDSTNLENSFVVVGNVFENSPAQIAGIQSADKIIEIKNQNDMISGNQITISRIQEIISNSTEPVDITIVRKNSEISLSIQPELEIISNAPAIGISMQRITNTKLPFFFAVKESYITTGQMIVDISVGLSKLIYDAFTGNGSFDNVAGPVGIVKIVGNAADFGFVYLLGFTAFISINLAVLNILPFPALDGGRLVVVLIESIIRRPLKPQIVNVVNLVGFIILILLMIIITIKDFSRIF
ncbi:MAG TPA: site-2 protease family protein [Candidatus Paceibacterota bacterium]|nr:site-2 protease family protein [Candidatus Paceibacterota bacterium]